MLFHSCFNQLSEASSGLFGCFLVFFLNWSDFSLKFFLDAHLHCFPLKGVLTVLTCNTENKWLNGIKMQTFSFILRGFWGWIDSFWMPGVAPLPLFLNFPAVLAVPWHKSISCVGFSGDGWCCRPADLEGAVLGQVCHRTEEAFSSTHGLLWRPIRQKKRCISTNMQHLSQPRERERVKNEEKMISSLNWDLLLGGSELTEPFLPPFFLALLCYPLQLRPYWDNSFFPQMLWVMWQLNGTRDLWPVALSPACRLPWVSEGPSHCEGIHSISTCN